MDFWRAQKRLQMKGVVSFLATFFTDLMMLDMAMEKYLEGNEINHQKKNKEYKVMTEIMLLQVAAGNYNLQPKDPCRASFKSMEWLNKDEK
uniref:ral-GDS-related protein-like isoform X2 n=1 Tax=Nyctereutes procyonoides TaxID=34880 RepID=UPI0024449AE5|nr:ral-GDS-related protein-like isoform X2 [Nyctereutes procyonoides]